MDIPLAAKFGQSKIAYFTIATLYARAKQQPNSKRQLLILTWLNHSKNWIHTHTHTHTQWLCDSKPVFYVFIWKKCSTVIFEERLSSIFGMKWVFSVVHLVPPVCIYIYFASKNWFFSPDVITFYFRVNQNEYDDDKKRKIIKHTK